MAGVSGLRKLEDLDITKHELDQIGEALKQKEFRKLLVDYVQEINDPENKKLFQSEITQLEKERGYDVTFINPDPGYVIKTSVDDEKKAFINVCKSDKIQKPSSVAGAREGSFGRKWSLPYSQAPPREDIDSSGKRCVVFDVVFHPEALDLAGWNVPFRNMLNDTALDGVESNYNVKLDRKNLKFPKMKYKGTAAATVIRKKSESFKPDDELEDVLSKMKYPFNELKEETTPNKTVDKKKDTDSANRTPYTTPKYIIKHRNVVEYQDFMNDRNAKLNATLPKEIFIEIDLPLLNSTRDAILDVTEKSLLLVSEKPAKYKLYISLPYIVDEDSGNAKFDKIKRKLQITLPLKHRQVSPLADFGREDSGVESDIGNRSTGSSSGEDENTDCETKLSYKDISHNIISNIEEINGNLYGDSGNEDMKSTVECEESCENSEMRIEVTKCSKDETIVEITPFTKEIETSNLKHDEKGSESSKDNMTQEVTECKKVTRHPMLQKCRTLSESSGDEMSFSPSKKGILKRISRSLSESSADDYTWSSSHDTIMQSGSDSCIPEEEGQGIKKTVRFNEIVHQQTYRSNSSIFGQRKKNQRKMRNKKRAQERRASESENSEGECEKDSEKEVKTEKNEENEQEEDGNEEDDSPDANEEEVIEIQLKLQDEKIRTSKKSSFGFGQNKGKKKIRKPVSAPGNKTDNSQVDLQNELIFDLDL